MLKKIINNLCLAIGIIGLVMFMFGLTETNIAHKNLIVLFATYFLVFVSSHSKRAFFTGLQGIAFVQCYYGFL